MLSLLVRVLEILFGIGIIGSAIVVVWTFVEDLRDLGSEEEVKAEKVARAPATSASFD